MLESERVSKGSVRESESESRKSVLENERVSKEVCMTEGE